MKLLLILILSLLLVSVSSATQESLTMGPYKVSFDIGLTRNDYIVVSISNPEEIELLGGDKEFDYVVDIVNRTGQSDLMRIRIEHFEKEVPIATGSNFKDGLDSKYQSDDTLFSNYRSSVRTIDGAEGAIASMTSNVSGNLVESYVAAYQCVFDPTHTVVVIESTYPWEEGTLLLLKTIHVDTINATYKGLTSDKTYGVVASTTDRYSVYAQMQDEVEALLKSSEHTILDPIVIIGPLLVKIDYNNNGILEVTIEADLNYVIDQYIAIVQRFPEVTGPLQIERTGGAFDSDGEIFEYECKREWVDDTNTTDIKSMDNLRVKVRLTEEIRLKK